MALHRDDIPDRYEFKRLYPAGREWINAGDSAVVSPEGEFIAGPLHQQKGLLVAELDPAQFSAARWMFDAAGHYARPDVFQLTVRRVPRPLLGVTPGAAGTRAARPRTMGRGSRTRTTRRTRTRTRRAG
jgi:hypothetical protein